MTVTFIIKRYIALIICFVILTSVGGAFAAWIYFDNPTNDVNNDVDLSLKEFEWKPEDLLPTESQLGENHFKLVDLVLNEWEKGYGLNYDKKQVLEQYLNKDGIFYSNQKTTQGNVKFVSDETSQLYYCITKESDTKCYIYTFEYDDLNSAKGTSEQIVVYLTILEKTTSWNATKSYYGYAKTQSLRQVGVSNVSGTLAYSIDPDSWTIS